MVGGKHSAFDFDVEGRWKKGRPNKTWKKQVEVESVKVGLSKIKMECWH